MEELLLDLPYRRSQVFNNEFFGAFAGAGQPNIGVKRKLALPDVSPAAFRRVLAYMYTGSCRVPSEDALPTLYAAKKWVPELSTKR